jgi:hypothetical protein
MTRFEFASAVPTRFVRQESFRAESFNDALSLVSKNVTVQDGDTLEIGCRWFPPARYAFVATDKLDCGELAADRPTGCLALGR